MTRRELGRTLALPAAVGLARAAGPEPYDRQYPDMLATYLVSRLNRLAEEHDRKRAAIRTPDELHARNRWVRAKVVEMVGGFPARNPLGARVLKTVERADYRVENVMFQSRPDFWVTANLYIPAGRGPHPAIISPCGHYPLARMLPSYQLAYQSLVKAGFVVLAFDPIGQGERRQYWNPETGVTDVGSATTEHSMAGQLLILQGETLTGYRIWDAMRAIDYLETRSEVDAKRIGCTGHSGGGTLTMFTAAVDERIGCAVIHEGGSRARWPIRLVPFAPIGPSDVEQNLFPGAFHGVDSPDLHIAVAPRPLMATIENYSPEFLASTDRVKERYRMLGIPDKFTTVEAADPHAWTYKLRLATVDWFSRWAFGKPGPASEPKFTPERPEDLRCTPSGSLLHAKHGKSVWTSIWSKPAPKPVKPSTADLRRLLRLDTSNTPLAPRATHTVPREGYTVEKLAILSEPGIYLPVWVFQPKGRPANTPPVLYCNESGKDGEGMEFEGSEASGLHRGLLATMAERGHRVVAFDVRGVGETRTAHGSRSSNSFGQLFDTDTAFAYMAWFMNRSLLGMRVHDVLRAVDYALTLPDAGRGVWLIGKDMAATLALFAAALDPRVESVVCHRGLLSHASLTTKGVDRYVHGANVMIPGALRELDLPSVASGIEGRRLAYLSPVDAMRRRVDPAAASAILPRWARVTAEASTAPELANQYLELLRG